MPQLHLHIVTHDVPWPADYGGVVDLYWKIKTLHSLDVAVHLHCFTQGRPPQPELEKYCASVNYYQRDKSVRRFSFRIPFIVSSRISSELVTNLQKNNYPVLLEGIHCSWYLYKDLLPGRKVIVRLHNAEFEYYRQLARHEKNTLKRLYFLHESRLLKKYERRLANKAQFLAVSEQDEALYRQTFKAVQINYLPVFIPWTMVAGHEGRGFFCLYHGNLSVNENEEAACWLMDEVFASTGIPFVIAGKDPSPALQEKVDRQGNTCLVSNPSDKELNDLIGKAQIHVLPSLNKTGIKLKLLNAVFNGRHCLVNQAAVEGSGLEPYCHIASGAEAFTGKIKELFEEPFTEQEQQNRQGLLQQYNNTANAERLISFLR